MALFLVVVFVVVPLAELAVVVAAAESFGLGVTLFALLAFSLAGAWLTRREGTAVWRSANEELAAGRPPTRELLDGAMVLGGGALLLTPGFITDLVGLLLLLPPTRVLLRPLVMRAMSRRAGAVIATAGPAGNSSGFRSAQGGFRTVIINTDLIDTDLTDTDLTDTGRNGAGTRRAGRPQPTAKVIRVEPNSPDSRAELPDRD